MQLKNHDKIIAESLDMLRKIQSLPQYADRSLHEMSIRYLLVEKLDAADFKNVNDNLNAAAKNLETVEKYLKQFKVYDFKPGAESQKTDSFNSNSFASQSVEAGQALTVEADEGLSSPEEFLDAVPEVQKYLEVLQQQTDAALAKLEKLDISSDGFNKWIELPQIGKAFEKFRDYIPLVNAASELALKSQTFAGGIVNGMKTFQQRVGRSLKPIIKKAEDAAKQGNINAQSEEALEALKIGKDSTIEQIFNLAGKNTEEEQKKAAADIRREIGGTKIKNMFNFFKNIKILPGLQQQLMAPVQAQSRQIDKMPEEMAAALMKVKIENLMDPKFFNLKLEKQDAQESVEAVKDAEEATEELQDQIADIPKKTGEGEEEISDQLKDSIKAVSKERLPWPEMVPKMFDDWIESLDPLTRKHVLPDSVIKDLKSELINAFDDEELELLDPDVTQIISLKNLNKSAAEKTGAKYAGKVEKAIEDWANKPVNKKLLNYHSDTMGFTDQAIMKDLKNFVPKLVNFLIQRKQESRRVISDTSIIKLVHSFLDRKYGRIISESKRLQRWQLLAGLK